ncbi:MAG TPA: hypothetical protein VFE51_08990 [Verrucomicrobiae bacterium]|nr:hypothetical protein [Verrucomicrobiae bacterium]
MNNLRLLERQLIADAERVSIHEESIFSGLVLDGEIISPAKQLLLHQVAHIDLWHAW